MQRFAHIVFTVFALIFAGCSRAPDDSVVRLRFWHAWGGYEGKVLQDLIDEFNQTHPHIQVQASQFTIGDKLLASIAGGKPPDIATVWSYMLTPMGESGAFLPLDDFMTSSGFTADKFMPNVWNYGLYGKHRWGVPTTLNVTAIFYIRDLARQANLNPDQPPQTVAELETWSKALLKKDADGNVTTLGLVPTQYDVWMQCFGGELFDDATHRFTLDRPQNIQATQWMKSMVDAAGGMATYRRFTAQYGKLDSPSNPLFMNKLAMKEDGQWVIQFFNKFAPNIDYGIFPYPPAQADGVSSAKLDGSFWSIPVGTKHPDEAWEFLSWLIAPKQNARLCAGWLNLPPMRATMDEPDFRDIRKDPKFELFLKFLVDGKALPQATTPVSEQLYDKLETSTQRTFSNDIKARTMLEDLNNDLNAELDRTRSLLGSSEP